MESSSLQEKLDKIRSPNLESQKQTAILLEGIESAFPETNTSPTPTAYFAALLSLLKSDGAGSLAQPVVYLLDIVTPYTPEPLLRAKFTQIFECLAPVLAQPGADAPLIKASIGCLESLLLAQDAAAWEMSAVQIGPRRAVAGLLTIAMDPRPKVRKRAQEAIRKILQNPPPSPSLDHPVAPLCAETAMVQAAQALEGKKSANVGHDPELNHALHLVKAVASSSGGWPSKNIEGLCELLLGIAKSGNEHMSMAVFEIFEIIFEGLADEVASAKLPHLMRIIRELRPAPNDTQLLPPWIAILSRAYDVSAQVNPEETFQVLLVEPFNEVAAYLESGAKNIRISASECLVSFMANCIPRQVIVEPSFYDEKVLQQLAKTAEGLLTPKYHAAWLETCNVIGAMLEALRWRADPYLLGVVKTIGEMRTNGSFTGKEEADEVLGKAIQAMGPQAVLNVLPLNLPVPKGQQGRAWLLPLIRDNASNTNLDHFKSALVPLENMMLKRVVEHGTAEKTLEIKLYETLLQQLWKGLRKYCDRPLDLAEAFDQQFAELLGQRLMEHDELRLDICHALKKLVDSNQTIASASDEEDVVFLHRITKEAAQNNLKHLGTFADGFLALLFNIYIATLPQKRGAVLETIDAYLSIIPTDELKGRFDGVCEKLAEALQEVPQKEKPKQGQQAAPSLAHCLMDLVVAMSIYLPVESFEALFNVARAVIFRDDDPQLQKKAYKLIPRLASTPKGQTALGAMEEELQALLLECKEKVSAPARRERLAAIAAMIPTMKETNLHFIPSVLPEVVISCKEQNERARTNAFDLLVLMGEKMTSASGAMINNSKVPHMPEDAPMAEASLEEYITMVSAGLAGGTPHMISASIEALTRIMWIFRESLSTQTLNDLVETMNLYLTSNNREIVKSVLGFVKNCVISLPTELMVPRLAALIPNLMVWSHEHKRDFRTKVKHLIERMVRRFGVEIVTKYCPEEDKKLITNIRKSRERSKRKKEAAKHAGESGDEEGEQGARFDNAFDQVMYSSDDESDQSDGGDVEMSGRQQKKGARKGGNAFILEDEEDPLDLLGSNALAHISSTKPVKPKQRGKKKAKTDLDGKLVLGGDDAADNAMDVDMVGGAEESGVGAFVAALKGKDVPRRGRGGKLKFSNKRGRDDDDDEEDGMELDDADAKALKKGAFRGRGGDRGRRGTSGGGRGARGGRGGRGGIQPARRSLGGEKLRGPGAGGRVAKAGRGRG